LQRTALRAAAEPAGRSPDIRLHAMVNSQMEAGGSHNREEQ
jgi:hypothetical protein